MEDPIDWQLAKVFELSGMDMSRFYLSIDGKKRTIEGPQYSLNDLVYKLLQADPELAAVVTPAVKFKHYMGNYPDLPNYVLATGTDLTAPCAA